MHGTTSHAGVPPVGAVVVMMSSVRGSFACMALRLMRHAPFWDPCCVDGQHMAHVMHLVMETRPLLSGCCVDGERARPI